MNVRWFVLFLLIANIVLFLWLQQEALDRQPHVAMPAPDVGELRLRREMTSDRPGVAEAVDEPTTEPSADRDEVDDTTTAVDLSVVDPPQPASADGDETPAIDALATRVTEASDWPLDGTGGPVVDETTASPVVESSDFRTAESTASADDRAVQQPPQSPTPSIAATDGSNGREGDAPEVPPIDEMASSARAAACARVGPLTNTDADALLQRLPANVLLVADIREPDAKVDGYYVLVPALPNRAAGIQKLQELSDAGFTDTWLFRRGEFRNAISLGMYSRKASADRHAATVGAKGFDVEVREKTSPEQRRFLTIQHPADVELRDSLSLPDGASPTSQPCP